MHISLGSLGHGTEIAAQTLCNCAGADIRNVQVLHGHLCSAGDYNKTSHQVNYIPFSSTQVACVLSHVDFQSEALETNPDILLPVALRKQEQETIPAGLHPLLPEGTQGWSQKQL